MRIRLLPLAALGVALLAVGRLFVGPSYHVYNPIGARLVDGLPVTWEMVYYLAHLPTFLGDAVPAHTISSVHYRALSGLHLSSMLTVWLGSSFWSFAMVDMVFWLLAVVATYQLALRLGVARPAAALASLICLASPIFASSMWEHVLHLAEFASLPIGLWAAVVLVDEVRGHARLAMYLGALLVVLSLSYQYQWIVLPLLAILLVGVGRYPPRDAVVVTVGALGMYALATLAIRALLIVGRLDPLTNPLAEHMQAVAEPGGLVTSRVSEFLATGDLRTLLPRPDHFASTAQVYHPLVFAVGVGGVLLSRRTIQWMTLIASGISFVSFMLYPAPWTAMSAYPLIYIGAGIGCCAVGATVTAAGRALTLRNAVVERSGLAVATALALVLAASTNLDLVGDHAFLLSWWRLYYPSPLF